MSAKFKDISHHLLASLLDVSDTTREHWWMNQGYQNSVGDAQYMRNGYSALMPCTAPLVKVTSTTNI
jgi:hypothetical protein